MTTVYSATRAQPVIEAAELAIQPIPHKTSSTTSGTSQAPTSGTPRAIPGYRRSGTRPHLHPHRPYVTPGVSIRGEVPGPESYASNSITPPGQHFFPMRGNVISSAEPAASPAFSAATAPPPAATPAAPQAPSARPAAPIAYSAVPAAPEHCE